MRAPRALGFLLSLAVLCPPADATDTSAWPAITREMKPWTYWWWPGSAVDATNLTRELERFADAGYGGVHVIPIYGAKNADARNLDYLGDAWLAMLRHAIREGERLDLGLDMSLGTGWCFGGPNITTNLSGMMLDPKTLKPKPTGIRVKRAAPGGEGFMLNPFYGDAMSRYLERFTGAFASPGGADRPGEPGRAADRPALPSAVYHDSYEYAKANFTPDFFVEFKKRRGYDLETELKNLFASDGSGGILPQKSTDAGAGMPRLPSKLRCDYNETISDLMIENVMPKWIEWAHARGMKTRYQAHGSPANWLDLYALADIPETEMFHTDRDVLISKFASSAAHVTGKRLVSAETGTWLEEHFTETLGDMKKLVDQLFLSGVNHVYYHGACYSPEDAAWPGWLFYAATEMNSRNAIWRDLPALNAYIARCQSLLQAGEPDNDILLHWPIHNYWSHTKELAPMMTVHKREWFYEEEIGKTAKWLWDNGYTFDYVSDRQITNTVVRNGDFQTPGVRYRAIIAPDHQNMPNATAAHLLGPLASGDFVLFGSPGKDGFEPRVLKDSMRGVGLYDDPAMPRTYREALTRTPVKTFDQSKWISLDDERYAKPEPMKKEYGLNFIRRRVNGQPLYFIVNDSANAFDGWLPLRAVAKSVRVLDPMSGLATFAETRSDTNQTLVRLQLPVGASAFLFCSTGQPDSVSNPWKMTAEKVPIIGNWKIDFLSGGPEVPTAYTTDKLASWTERGGAAESFAGTARYTLTFDAPVEGGVPSPPRPVPTGRTMRGEDAPHGAGGTAPSMSWSLDLGDVHESARVKMNGRDLGTLIMPPYRVAVDNLKPTGNVLEVEVTNLSANRIRDLDRRKADWKVMKDINLVNIDYKPFDASGWPVRPGGLIGPVTLAPVAPAP